MLTIVISFCFYFFVIVEDKDKKLPLLPFKDMW